LNGRLIPTVALLEYNELIEEMRQRIEKLEKRVAELESQLATRHASGPKSSITPTPSYGPHPFIRDSTVVIWLPFPHSLNALPKGCVEKGMRASEIEHRFRMENYWNNPEQWHRQRDLCDIADLLAFEDHGDYVCVAGDATRAYSPEKVALCTRQIVFLRPGTFIVFDRVKAKDAAMKKT
jgi:hypothetical protein